MTKPHARKLIFRWLQRVGLVAVIGVVVAGLVYAFMPKPVHVDLARIEHGPMQVSVEEDGRTRIKERFVVASPLNGRLMRIQLDPGDTVTSGETLLAAIEPLDPSLLDARAKSEAEASVEAAKVRLKLTEPDLETAKAELENAESDLAEAKRLKERGLITQSDFDQVELVYRQAQQKLKSATFAQDVARFELKLAEAALIQTQDVEGTSPENTQFSIISPITGRVLRVFQESSTVVTPGENLIELGDPTDLEVVVDVLSSDAVRVNSRLHQKDAPPVRVLLEHWGGKEPIDAVVRLVEPSGFTKVSALGVEEQRVNVIIDFNESNQEKHTLGDGFRVEARIIVWEADDVLIVPTSALFRDKEQWAVFKVVDGRAVLTQVKIGERNGLQAQLLDGLEPGDTVVIHPGDQVQDGVKVERRH